MFVAMVSMLMLAFSSTFSLFVLVSLFVFVVDLAGLELGALLLGALHLSLLLPVRRDGLFSFACSSKLAPHALDCVAFHRLLAAAAADFEEDGECKGQRA